MKPSSHRSPANEQFTGYWDPNWQKSDVSLSLNIAGFPIQLFVETTEERQVVVSCSHEIGQNGSSDPSVHESLEEMFPVELLFSPKVLAFIFRLIVLHSTMDVATQDWQSEETNGFHPNETTHVPTYPTECQGTHEGLCTGDLWICSSCGKAVCEVENANTEPQICYQCWDRQYTLAMMPDTQEGAAAVSETIVIGCDCVESGGECGTWLELSPDGILAVEDKDGERLSIMLPLWLDQVIRYAFAQQQAVENC